jgi:hypothetical protein
MEMTCVTNTLATMVTMLSEIQNALANQGNNVRGGQSDNELTLDKFVS